MIHTGFANDVLRMAVAKADTIDGTGKCYLGFSSTAPNKDGSGFTEPDAATYPSYKRIQLAITEALEYTDKWGDVADGTVTNAEEFTTAECLDENGWPEWSHFGIFDCLTGGKPLVSDLLRDPDGEVDQTTGLKPAKTLQVPYKHVAVFRKGTLTMTLE